MKGQRDGDASSQKALSLFVPFYTPKDPERAAELVMCLRRNLDCAEIDHVYLLQDDDTPLPFEDSHLTVLMSPRRPTYLDWVRHSQRLCPDHVSVLANSDIYFNEDIAKLIDIFAARTDAFVALSRYDKIGDTSRPHPNPHWSQDSWAFLPNPPVPQEMETQLDIPLGVPRCDNKVAYVFSLNGYTVVNPFHDIHSVHVHETALRYYDKKHDTQIKGATAMVHPSPSLKDPATLDIEIWSLNSAQYAPPKINRSLEKWRAERIAAEQSKQQIFAFDEDWQYPAVTEQHAYLQMRKKAGSGFQLPEDTAYLAFPWATLIDLSTHAQNRSDKIATLKTQLGLLRTALAPYRRILTVCQHIRLREHIHLFADAGVTDVFWSHCQKDQGQVPERPDITLHPFPLFPVQQVPVTYRDIHAPRPLLYSFVGAKSTEIYMTQSRNMILEALQNDPEGKIIDRTQWHYNKVVYDKQITARHTGISEPLEDHDAAAEFRDILQKSVFTLCPSGTGPNSIRLWEAALNGSIPVVLSDQYAPPDAAGLWSIATVHCAETLEAIQALPDRLKALQADTNALRQKQLALYLLREKYGPDNFIHDIVELARS